MNPIKKKFLFINPPYDRLKGFTVSQSVPLGLLYLATVLDDAGYEARVYDADNSFHNGGPDYTQSNRAKAQAEYVRGLCDDNHPAWKELKNLLIEYRPDYVGITVTTPAYASCKKVAGIIRELLPKTLLLAGGPHVTIVGQRALDGMPEIDVAFLGEAEHSILEFADACVCGRDLTQIKGIVFLRNGKIFFSGHRNRIEDLDALPLPKRNLLFNAHKFSKHIIGSLIASRGCPFSCTFCATVTLWGRKAIFRSAQNIMSEIDYLVTDYNIRNFKFWDDNFTLDKERTITLCRLIINKYGSRGIKWTTLVSAKCIDDEVVYWMKRSGCNTIRLGVESGSNRVLEKINKNVSAEELIKVARIIKKNGFWLHAYFIAGFPFESEQDIESTIKMIKQIKPNSINVNTFTPYPGTELYNYLVSEGIFDAGADYEIYKHISNHNINNFFGRIIPPVRYRILLDYLFSLADTIERKNIPYKLLWKLRNATYRDLRDKLASNSKALKNLLTGSKD